MARINLLPWREELRAERQQLFFVHTGIAIALGVVVSFAGNTQVAQWTEQQRERNEFLKAEIAKVEAEIKEIESLQEQKERLLKRTEVIEQLQQTRAISAHYFDELVEAAPPGVYLLSADMKGDALEFKGVSESSGAVSDFMRKIEASEYMGSPSLVIIENKDKGREKRREFTVKAKITPPKVESAEDAAAPGGTKG
jgi:type IV pilus assembly protein PilN